MRCLMSVLIVFKQIYPGTHVSKKTLGQIHNPLDKAFQQSDDKLKQLYLRLYSYLGRINAIMRNFWSYGSF